MCIRDRAIEKVLTTAATTTPTTNGSSSSPTTPSTSATIDAILATTSTTTSDGAVDVDPQLISEDESGWRQVVTSEGTQFFLLEAGIIYDDGGSDTIRSETAPTYSRYANETFADFERRYNTYYHARRGVRGSEVNVMQEDISVSYTHLRAHETPEHLVCRLLLEKKKKK
eukprot:TRINITY_DN10140_c0_g1_i1.p1 TRINITY_DN10140_c0_g1~~TRINITY_DN10140_c0_g1_i1.p1  ORF type:complete len:170 (+),score=64.66 TRINITY_DN10140_c0_g1_i1:163-672(+)